MGLVTEIGGIPAHGSIVVTMGVNGATQRIKDGQTITVDGLTWYGFLLTTARIRYFHVDAVALSAHLAPSMAAETMPPA